MLLNYLKIAVRNLLKKRGYSAINILGLAIGLMSVGLILLHLEYEFSFDKFHAKKDRIYKVTLERIYPTHATLYDVIPHSFAETMTAEFGEVNNYVRVLGGFGGSTAVTVLSENGRNEVFDETDVVQADSTFFDFFSFNLITGDPKTVLDDPSNVVLSASTANKYFGKEEAVGKRISIGQAEFTVSGICEDAPENSHIKFSMVGALSGVAFIQNVNYISFSAHTYLLLNEDTDPAELEKKFPAMVENYAAAQIEQSLGTSYTDYVAAGNGYRYYLRPLTSIHLDPANIEAAFPGGGNRTFIRILISIAILILIIACINFMNLATARATERAKEVGIRKTLGSLKKQLVMQFLAESVLISLIAMVVALVLINLLLPSFNTLTGNELDPSYTSSYVFVSILFFSIFVGLLAGFYPAFILSAYNPVQVLKGAMATNKSGEFLRNGLVVFQFTISIILIAGTITIYQQLEYVQNKNLGFDKKQMLIIDNVFVLNDKLETFRNELINLPGVINAGAGSAVPGGFFFGFQFQQEGDDEIITTKAMQASGDFSDVLNLEILDGRSFKREIDDSLSIILNEAAVKAFGVTDPIGRKIYANQGAPPVRTPLVIVGVVKDFHFMSLKDEISPLVIVNDRSPFGFQFNMAIKLDDSNVQETISAIEAKWKRLVPEQQFKYDFLEARLDGQYDNEETSAKIFGIFALLAIFIACVGLFGLVAFTADQKTKEIGIRKVLGASVSNIIVLLTKHFTMLVLVSLLLAIPVAWYAMSLWLEGFAYKISLGVGTFLISGVMAILIAWATVAYQSRKAAIVNPVDSISSE